MLEPPGKAPSTAARRGLPGHDGDALGGEDHALLRHLRSSSDRGTDRGRDPPSQVVPELRPCRRGVGRVDDERLQAPEHVLDELLALALVVPGRDPVDVGALHELAAGAPRRLRGERASEGFGAPGHEEQREVAPLRKQLEGRGQRFDHPLGRRGDAREVLAELVGELLARHLADRGEEHAGPREVPVDGLAGDAEIRGDVGQRELRGIASIDTPHGGLDDALAALRPRRRAGTRPTRVVSPWCVNRAGPRAARRCRGARTRQSLAGSRRG